MAIHIEPKCCEGCEHNTDPKAKSCYMFRVKSFTCQINIERWDVKCKREAMALSKEKRQMFLDLMHNGYSIKGAYDVCGITFDEANGIIMLNITDVSFEYKQYMKEMQVAIDHHYKENSHHPEYFENGTKDMTLVDMIEMICDWKSATMRHKDGDIFKSIEINQKRYGYSNEIKQLLFNTAKWLDGRVVYHNAQES